MSNVNQEDSIKKKIDSSEGSENNLNEHAQDERIEEEEELLQFLSFRLSRDLYAIDIQYVKEVIEKENIYPVPRTPEYICGVTNLRGEVIPILDLFPFFFKQAGNEDDSFCIIFLELERNEKIQVIGLLVNEVLNVINIPENKIKGGTEIGSRIPFEYIKNITDFEDQFYTILDMDRMINLEKISEFNY